MRKFYQILSAFFVVIALCPAVMAQQPGAWREVDQASVGRDLFASRYRPNGYKLFTLSEDIYSQALSQLPSERSVQAARSSFIISIPNAEGVLQQFRAVETSVLDPQLAARYPSIKTYAGQGIEDPTAMAYFDFSPRGFHAMVLSADKPTYYVDPVDRNDKYYVVFSRKDQPKSTFRCLTEPNATIGEPVAGTGVGRGADDGRLRTYRLAMASTGEYSQYFLNGTEANDTERKTKVLAAMATLMVRTNGIYERDFGVRMILIANNDNLIYLNGGTDPWGNELNVTTQQTIDAVIGNANYDIGHLVHKEASPNDNNGNAGCIACVCKAATPAAPKGKGSAFTSHFQPEGDPFVVDFTTHEMGHQFGGNHTFTISNEGTGALMEPGSGSTIMGYAGITGSTDVQPHSDDYFHAKSIEQITDYIKGATGGGCAVTTVTGNATPTANAGADYTIPRSTPFALTAQGTDADAADVLTYTWEQYNNGSTAVTFPNPNNTTGPLFRSRPYSTSPVRVFPILTSILNGTNANTWERLPGVARTMDFRLTVRDNHVGGGNTRDDDMRITVAGTAGPFEVTSPNTTVSWDGGSQRTITWNVANSDQAPVSCANVKISLSTDGGLTFPTVLAASTPNDGSHEVTIPSVLSTTARIKIEAVGNIFFDISNTNFSITVPQPTFDLGTPAAVDYTCGTGASASITLSTTSVLAFATPINLSATGNPAGTTVTITPNPVTPGSNAVITLNNISSLAVGSFNVTINATAGAITRSRVLTFNVVPGAGPVITTAPQSQGICDGGSATFTVASSSAVNSYQWQISTNGGTDWTNISNANDDQLTVNGASTLQNGHLYRVVLAGPCNTTISAPATLTVYTLPTVSLAATRTAVTPGESATLTATVVPGSSANVTVTWYFNGQVLNNVVNNSVVADVTRLGDYRVTVTDDNGCGGESSTLSIAAKASTRLFIFPVPNDGQFTVSYYNSTPSNTKQSITVYDSKGARVYSNNFTVAGQYTLHSVNLKALGIARGVYHVVVGDGAGKKLAEGSILVN